MKDLAGRVAVVTGGASGIGRGLAERFATESMRVVVADIEEPPLHETVRSIRAAGGEAMAVTCDVSSWPSVEALRDACTSAYGPADVLCNNAGVAATGTMAELSLQSWEWCLGVNLWGVIHGCRAFLDAMIERGSGHIVNTASILGHLSSAGLGPYNVSKHGVVAISETLHAEMLAGGDRGGRYVPLPRAGVHQHLGVRAQPARASARPPRCRRGMELRCGRGQRRVGGQGGSA